MHHENELVRQKTEEDLAQPDDVSTGSDTSTVDQRSTDNVALVEFLPGEPANPHNWSMVRLKLSHGLCQR